MLKYSMVLCLGLLWGCASKGPHAPHELFDTKSFFESQIQTLEQNYGVAKVMLVGDKRDSLFLDSVAWTNELAAFTTIDLRKPAYTGRFSVDSVVQSNDIVIHYQRIDQSTDLEHVWISKHENEIVELKFVYGERNELYASAKQLIYHPGKDFEISGNQAVQLSSPFTYEVKGIFIPISNQ